MYETQFMELYRRLGVVTETNQGVPLHTNCGCREACWRVIAGRTPPPQSGERSHISLPWVGSNYGKAKLLVVGENLNECGGLGAVSSLVRQAQEKIRAGRRRIFKGVYENGEKYNGTDLYFKAGSYVTALISEYLPELALPDEPRLSLGQLIAVAYDYIAYTNQVKCSPSGKKSSASPEMWKACGRHILKEEINILKPEKILILGVQNNKYFFGTSVLDSEPKWSPYGTGGTVFACDCSLDGRSLRVFAVPHPSYFRAKRETIRAALADAVDKLSQ